MKAPYLIPAFIVSLSLALCGCGADDLLQRGQAGANPCAAIALSAGTNPFAPIAQKAAQNCPDPGDNTEPSGQISFDAVVKPALQQCTSCHAGGAGGWTYDGGGQAHAQTLTAVDSDDPANSPLLRKAANQSSHGGGEQFGQSSEEYINILAWIEAGGPDN